MIRVPMTEGMTDEERDAAWARYFAERSREADAILKPLREEVGYPTDPHDPDCWFGVDNEVHQRYIEALEGRIVAEELVRREFGRRIR